MEREEKRVEVDEIDLGFFKLHILFKVSPRGYVEAMGTYKVEKRDEKIQKMTVFGAKLVITYSNLFTYYEQDIVKYVIFKNYYNNVYQGWYENWKNMSIIRRENEWLKEILIIEEGTERLWQHSSYGWSFVDYLHTPKNT
jgi:hypothetical protein